jgi:hypothetical protein
MIKVFISGIKAEEPDLAAGAVSSGSSAVVF